MKNNTPKQIEKQIEKTYKCLRILQKKLFLAKNPEIPNILEQVKVKAAVDNLSYKAIAKIHKLSETSMSLVMRNKVLPSEHQLMRWYCDSCLTSGKLLGTKDCASCRAEKYKFHNKKACRKSGKERARKYLQENKDYVNEKRRLVYAFNKKNFKFMEAKRKRERDYYYKKIYGSEFAEAGRIFKELQDSLKVVKNDDK